MMLSLLLFSLCFGFSLSADCKSSKESGTFCSQPTQRMFYYDTRYKVCQPFQYNGCGGNENKFSTAQECKDTCVLGKTSAGSTGASVQNRASSDDVFVPQGTGHDQWRKADKCGGNFLVPNGEYTKCSPSCPPNHTCTQGVCCPSKEYLCSLRDDSGSFIDGIEDKPRFGWSHDTQSCVRFSYYGANGNYNNFPNFYSCVNYCKDVAKLA